MTTGICLQIALICAITIGAFALKFPDDDATCEFLQRVHRMCPVDVPGAYQPLFADSGLGAAAEKCDGILDTSRLRNLRVDTITYVLMTSRCGLLFKDPGSMQIPDEIITEALVKLLSVPAAIRTFNCIQVKQILQYITSNLINFFQYLDGIFDLINVLDPEDQVRIISVLPGDLCGLSANVNIEIFATNRIAALVDALAGNCYSNTVLSDSRLCTWRDSPYPNIKAIAEAKQAPSGSNDEACIPEGSGSICPIHSNCVKLLCMLDLQKRPCKSACPRPKSMDACPKNDSDKCLGTREEAMSVPLPGPEEVTTESLHDNVCCMLRYPRKALNYTDEQLCTIEAPTSADNRCLQAFARWQIVHAAKCKNCTAVSHTFGLLSIKCRAESVKMYPTHLEQVQALVKSTGSQRRNALLALFGHLYQNLDFSLEEIVCIKDFMRVVNIETFKGLGVDELEPVLEAMAACEDPPAPAQVLTVILSGPTCPFFILEKEGHNLMRIGAITDKCIDDLSVDEALTMCSILMADKAPRIAASKIKRMCNMLATSDKETTCVFCEKVGTGQMFSPKVQVERCLILQQMTRTSLSRAQRTELDMCKPCPNIDGSTSPLMGSSVGNILDTVDEWCDDDFTITDISQIEIVLTNLCTLMEEGPGICQKVECFVFKKAISFYRDDLVKRDEQQAEYSGLQYLQFFMENNRSQVQSAFPCLTSRTPTNVCPFVKLAFKAFLSSGASRNRRDACSGKIVIEGFSEIDQKGSLHEVLEEDDLTCLDGEETLELIRSYSLNYEDWKPVQARVLLNKVLQAFGKQNVSELTTDSLRELGLILISLTPDEIKMLQTIDPNTFAVLGSSSHWSMEQHRALVEKYLQQEGRSASAITTNDIFTLQYILNGFTHQEVAEFPSSPVREASAVIGSLELCDVNVVKAFLAHYKGLYGNSADWDEAQLAEWTYLLGGLSADEWNEHGLTILGHVPDHVWRYHVTETEYDAFNEDIKGAITERQLELIRETGECSLQEIVLPTTPVSTNGAANVISNGFWFLYTCLLVFGL